MVTVSLHKTGGSLTQSSVLLLNEKLISYSQVRTIINLMQTTSASYLLMASLDHGMWFHRPARVDDWLLYSCDSPSSGGGRGLARGLIYDRDGRLIASTIQEGMIRVGKPPAERTES